MHVVCCVMSSHIHSIFTWRGGGDVNNLLMRPEGFGVTVSIAVAALFYARVLTSNPSLRVMNPVAIHQVESLWVTGWGCLLHVWRQIWLGKWGL